MEAFDSGHIRSSEKKDSNRWNEPIGHGYSGQPPQWPGAAIL
jgi:hypothetical protein